MDALGTATSVALQYGVPIESLVSKFSHQRFEPSGITENSDIPFAKSLVDYIFRWMGMEFVQGYREANAPRREPAPGTMSPGADRAGMQGARDETRWSTDRQDGAGNGRLGTARGDSMLEARPGAGNGHAGGARVVSETVVVSASTLSVALDSVGDAPACDTCGTITVRSGTCYKCLNCGASLGCS